MKDENMNKKIVLGSIFATTLIVLASFPIINASNSTDIKNLALEGIKERISNNKENITIKELIYLIVSVGFVFLYIGVVMLKFMLDCYVKIHVR
jgi:membrane protein CcdC involved in cytochrome C biogenesis